MDTNTPLIQALKAYIGLNRRRFHVPGHAGNGQAAPWLAELSLDPGWLTYDLTELDGLDALAHPEGVIQASQSQAAQVFDAYQTWYCVNGASVAIQAAMMAAISPGDTVLLPRNAHRVVISGLIMCGAKPAWLLPEWNEAWAVWGGVSVAALERAYQQNPTAKAVMLTHPTYEGIPSDIVVIANWCKAHNLRLIVDEAHGCLWPLLPDCFPTSALTVSGVDAVVHSLHKTGGSLTQTALLHLPQASQLDAQMIQEALNHLHTTSPSYLLMASLEGAIAWLACPQGREQIEQTVTASLALKQSIASLPGWRVAGFNDPMRCLIRHAHEDPEVWASALEAYPPSQAVAYEAVGSHSALYCRQLGLTPGDDATLLNGLAHWNNVLSVSTFSTPPWASVAMPSFALPAQTLSPREAFFAPAETVVASAALGRIAQQTVVRCPPGIPVLVPGERIESHHLPYLPVTVRVVR